MLTQTSLRTLPLWILGSDEVKEEIAERSKPQTAETEYARGLRALAGRDYNGAATAFFKTEQQGLRAPTIRALLVYSLCLARPCRRGTPVFARTRRPQPRRAALLGVDGEELRSKA